jgi:hypothetical protein
MKPEHAVFGTQGDFITSPDISQMFGEVRFMLLHASHCCESAKCSSIARCVMDGEAVDGYEC